MGWNLSLKLHSDEQHKIVYKYEGKPIAYQIWERFETEFENITKFVDS